MVGLLLHSGPTLHASNLVVAAYLALMSLVVIVVGAGALAAARLGQFTFLVANIHWFVLPAAFYLAAGEQWLERRNIAAPPDSAARAASLLCLFASIALFTYSSLSSIARPCRPSCVFQLPNRHLVFFVAILGALGTLPFFLFGGSVREIFAGILGSRAAVDKAWGQAAFQSNPLNIIGRASMVLCGSLSLFVLITRQARRALWALTFLLAFAVTYFDSGTRSWTVMMLAPPLLECARQWAAKGQLRRVLAYGAAALAGVAIVGQLQLQLRSRGVTAESLRTESANLAFSPDNDFFTETAMGVSLIRDDRDYVKESVALLFLVNPIPRSWWPNKPYPRTVEEYGIGRTGRNEYLTIGVSRMPSVVGQYYMTSGVVGVIEVGLLFGLLVFGVDRVWARLAATPLQRLWAATAAAWLFVSFRGLYPGFHYPVVFLGLIVLYERSVSKRRQAVASAKQSANLGPRRCLVLGRRCFGTK